MLLTGPKCSLAVAVLALVAHPVTSMRPQIARTVRTLGRRANSNVADKAKVAAEDAASKAKNAAEDVASKAKNAAGDVAENPQVQKAVASANAAFTQASAAVSRVTGPVGDKVGNMMGCELTVEEGRGKEAGVQMVGDVPCARRGESARSARGCPPTSGAVCTTVQELSVCAADPGGFSGVR